MLEADNERLDVQVWTGHYTSSLFFIALVYIGF